MAECEQYYQINGHTLSRDQMIESYMVFGGIPFYLDLMSPRMGLTQNIDALCFARHGELAGEFDELYLSLFRHAERHIAIVRALASKTCGLTRLEISESTGIAKGGTLTSTLDELEASDFVRRYTPFGRKSRGTLFQLVDPFSLFYLRFMESRSREDFWQNNYRSPQLNAWRGYAFELVCLLHERQILQALGIGAISSDVCLWRSEVHDPGAQVDLVIDRADGIINLCEMKWSADEFVITKPYDRLLRGKIAAFAEETSTRKALHLTMVTPHGVKRNAYWGSVQSEVVAEDLFA